MESNEHTEITSKIQTDSQMESRLTALGGRLRSGGLEQKKKELVDTDNNVMIVGGAGRGRWKRA